MKNFTCYIFFILIINNAFAQKQNVYYLKNNGNKVSTKDSAEFIRIVSEPDPGDSLYNLKEYYKDGKLKSTCKTLSIEGNVLQGAFISFFPSGKKQRIGEYDRGELVGNLYDYYPNGKLYSIQNCLHSEVYDTENKNTKYTVITVQDSTGNVVVENGTGYYRKYRPDFKTVIEEGKLKNSQRDSICKGTGREIDSLTFFTEKYDNGKLLTGECKDLRGTIYQYSQRDIAPSYQGGQMGFNKILAKTVKYPQEAKQKPK